MIPSARATCATLVQRIADAGESRFQVARLAANDDPAFLVVKTLELEYTQAGKQFTVRATDPETVDLMQPEPEAGRPAEIRCGENDRVFLHALRAGHYQLTTSSGRMRHIEVPPFPPPIDLAGPWEVRFDPQWGGPERVTFETLEDWSLRPEDGIRYYSGEAVYRKTFTVASKNLTHNRQILELGKVAVMAEVELNGHNLGILWKPPFRLDVSDVLKSGENELEVRVVNLWINRLIGDEQLADDSERNPDGTLKTWPPWVNENLRSPTGRYTFTSWRLWKKDEVLQESGLLGPVQIVPMRRFQIERD